MKDIEAVVVTTSTRYDSPLFSIHARAFPVAAWERAAIGRPLPQPRLLDLSDPDGVKIVQ